MTAIVRTTGNPDAHVALRSGRAPNYDAANIAQCCAILRKAGLDWSHAQANKDFR